MTKRFDCVELQHQGGERLMQMMEGMTLEQRVAYWRKRGEALRRLQRRLRAKMDAPTARGKAGAPAGADA
jgi:hypothetical protein